MHRLDHDSPVQGVRERTTAGEPVRRPREGRESGVPHYIHVVSDDRDPVEPHVEVDALALVVVLDEREQAGAGIEVVLQPARRQYGRERPERQLSPCPGQIGAPDDVTTATPRRAELEIGTVTAVELTPVHECPEAQGATRVRSEERRVGKECRSRWSPY